jgi:hypothetical protein
MSYSLILYELRYVRSPVVPGLTHLAVSLPVTLFMTVKAFNVSSWSSFSLRIWVRRGVLNLSLALLLPRSTLLFEVRFVLDRHHMAAARALLDVTFLLS